MLNPRPTFEEFLQKTRAHNHTTYLIRKGHVKRPNECDDCGEHKNTHAHHLDYSKPEMLRWLCAKCHGKAHILLNKDKKIRTKINKI